MNKTLTLFLVFLCISFAEKSQSQCVFDTPEHYGLMCDVAVFLCGHELDGYQGDLIPGKSPLPQPYPMCAGSGEPDNIQWFSFVADSDDIEIDVNYSDCNGGILGPGLQVGLYSTCELNPDSSPIGMLDCYSHNGYTTMKLQASAPDIIPGDIY